MSHMKHETWNNSEIVANTGCWFHSLHTPCANAFFQPQLMSCTGHEDLGTHCSNSQVDCSDLRLLAHSTARTRKNWVVLNRVGNYYSRCGLFWTVDVRSPSEHWRKIHVKLRSMTVQKPFGSPVAKWLQWEQGFDSIRGCLHDFKFPFPFPRLVFVASPLSLKVMEQGKRKSDMYLIDGIRCHRQSSLSHALLYPTETLFPLPIHTLAFCHFPLE